MNLDLGYTQLLLDECKKQGLLRNQAAYVLASCYWETARTMEPVREAFWLSENWRKRNLRYYPWYGRGFIQLTWRDNYVRAKQKLGVDFTSDPDRVMKPEYSAKIAVIGCKEGWFTGKKLADFIDLQRSDYVNARRIVNLMDKAEKIAHIAKRYDIALQKSGYGESQQVDLKKTIQKGGGFIEWLLSLFKR